MVFLADIKHLKSLNMLLDNKWNLKVTFKHLSFPLFLLLTSTSGERLRADQVQSGYEARGRDSRYACRVALKRNDPFSCAVLRASGTIHWTAPEVLQELSDIDYVQADVLPSPAIGKVRKS